jgi:hypothetical protein
MLSRPRTPLVERHDVLATVDDILASAHPTQLAPPIVSG